MNRALVAAAILIGPLACSKEHASPSVDAAPRTPTIQAAVPDTATIRLDRIEYRLLYNYGDTSADLVAHQDSMMTAFLRSPADSALVRVVLSGPPRKMAGDVVLNLLAGARITPRESPLGEFDSTGLQSFGYRLPGPKRCDSVVVNAYLQRGSLQFGMRRARVLFDFECEE